MSNNSHVYKQIELVGSSTKSSDDAIVQAIARASETLRNLDWFEVTELRGHIKDGKIEHWQVGLKIGMRLEDGDYAAGADCRANKKCPALSGFRAPKRLAKAAGPCPARRANQPASFATQATYPSSQPCRNLRVPSLVMVYWSSMRPSVYCRKTSGVVMTLTPSAARMCRRCC